MRAAAGLLLAAAPACSGGRPPTAKAEDVAAPPASPVAAAAPVPASMRECADCHAAVVRSYLGHGMSRSIGTADGLAPGVASNPANGNRYEVTVDAGGGWITTTLKDGGRRRQRVVGSIGAGIVDRSWVTAEAAADDGGFTGRLFFAPVETVTGRGLELSPFEHHPRSAGPDLALTESCLTCHTGSDLARLPGAQPYPSNHLGAEAFAHLSALTCSDCHGDVARHPGIFSGEVVRATPDDVGLTRLGGLPPGVQRDVCARCHLQGDARIDLVKGRARRGPPLAGQIPVLVPEQALTDFRFVGQLERLALSACFKGSPSMTCTTCHQPHAGVTAQGVDSFDAACARCHEVDAGHTPATVAQVTGHPARSGAGCVDCHVRRSQPFDLPHVRSADHFIQRRIRAPQDDIPHRPFADGEGEVEVFDDGRLAARLATPQGRRWRSGVLAMGLVSLGRFDEAARLFEEFAPPGSAAARRPSGPAGDLVPLETHPSFHTVRGMVLMARGRLEQAEAAFSDAIALDPTAAAPRLSRARLHLGRGDVPGALRDTQAVIDAYPHAEQPWDLRVEIAERVGRPDLALSALRASARLWPSNPVVWLKMGTLLRKAGDAQGAEQALAQARRLRPSMTAAATGGR